MRSLGNLVMIVQRCWLDERSCCVHVHPWRGETGVSRGIGVPLVPATGTGPMGWLRCSPGSAPLQGWIPTGQRGWLWIDSLTFEKMEVVTMGAAGRCSRGRRGGGWRGSLGFPRDSREALQWLVRKHEITHGPVLVLRTVPCGHLFVCSRVPLERKHQNKVCL